MAQNQCRLCQGAAEYLFSKPIMNKWRADYHRCASCHSLQVAESPWLAEVYELADKYQGFAFDTGLVARNLRLAGFIATFLRAANFSDRKILDYGGGTGLLTRLLRDMGFNTYCYDSYKSPQLVGAFHVRTLDACKDVDIAIAVEVLEHFTDPAKDLEELLRAAPLVIFTTDLYAGQSEDWEYLSTFNGQHVMFYSTAAMEYVERRFDVKYLDVGVFKMFIRRNFLADAALEDLRKGLHACQPPASYIHGLLPYLSNPFGHVLPDYEQEKAAWVERTFHLV